MNFQASKINEQTPWQEMTPGGEIYEGGTAKAVRTGEWRSDVPVWDPACLLYTSATSAVLPLLSRWEARAPCSGSGWPRFSA